MNDTKRLRDLALKSNDGMLCTQALGAADTIDALAAERDKWHAGWMEAEAKVSELEAERDALKALLDSVDDLSSALEQYNVKYNALAEENDSLKAELHDARMQLLVDFGKLQEACEENVALKAEVERLREALTPSGDTKAAYMGEIECDCPAVTWRHDVPWVSIKAIMAMIRDRAALQENIDD